MRRLAAFVEGLNETGYIEGHNVASEYRWADGQYDRLPALATELAQQSADCDCRAGGDPVAALAAKAASTTVPIVCNIATDPVETRPRRPSLNRPDGNATVVSSRLVLQRGIAKQLVKLLCELIPTAAMVGFSREPEKFRIP